MTDFLDIAARYDAGVLDGTILASRWIHLAHLRSRNDHVRESDSVFPFRFDRKKASHICEFIRRLTFVSDAISTKAGQKFQLRPDQVWLLCELYGWVWKDSGLRRFRRFFDEEPRGNGKSCLASAVGLYTVAADGGAGVQVLAAASLRPQARIVLDCARQMALADRDFCDAYNLEISANEIRQRHTNNIMKALPAVATSTEGASINLGILDEVHAMRGRKLHDALDSGCAKKPEALLWCCTTAGDNDAGIAFEIDEYVQRILNGEATDESFLGILHGINPEDRWDDPQAWRRANPGYGISVNPRAIEASCARAKQVPGMRASFRSRHLNEWIQRDSDEPFLEERKIAACLDPKVDESRFFATLCEIGVDLASRLDLSAVVRVHAEENNRGKPHFYAFARAWLPSETLKESRVAAYPKWVETNEITVTPGSTTDQDQIEEFLVSELDRYQVRSISFDPLQSLMLTQHLQRRCGRDELLVEIAQSAKNLTSGCLLLQELVADGRLTTNSSLLVWCLKNLRIKRVGSSMYQPVRPTDRSLKVDGAVALVMALTRYVAKPIDAFPYIPKSLSFDGSGYATDTTFKGDYPK